MFLSKRKFFFNSSCLIIAIHTLMSNNLAHAVFGQSDVPLEDYYIHGKSHTGVAVVNIVTNELGISLGTANLVDVGIESLRGRVLVTDAHVLNNTNPKSCNVRFIEEDNNFLSASVQSIHFPEDYKITQQDIGFIVLKNAVDIKKFKPLKLNLIKDNESLVGSKITIIGCTDIMGHAGSNVAVEEGILSPLRRGMETLLRYGSNTDPLMNFVFHPHTGFIKITRDPEETLTIEALLRKKEIECELEALRPLMIKNKEEGIKDANLEKKYFELIFEQLPQEVTRKGLQKKIVCDETFKNQLTHLSDTDDLDKDEIIKEWAYFITEKNCSIDFLLTEKSMQFGKYQIDMYKPLPRLSGIIYHGDSGGAWIIGDEIVALTKGGHIDSEFFHNLKIIKETTPPHSQDLSQYFAKHEANLKAPQNCTTPLLKTDSTTAFGTSIWSCKDWIELTLKKIELDLSEPVMTHETKRSAPLPSPLTQPPSNANEVQEAKDLWGRPMNHPDFGKAPLSQETTK